MLRVRSNEGQDRSPSSAPNLVSFRAAAFAAATAAVLLIPSRGDAQTVRPGVGHASLRIAANASVPVRLEAEQAGAPVVVSGDADFITVDVPVRVAANMSWTLAVSAAPAQAAAPLHVLDAHGTWVPFVASDPVSVLDRRDATNPRTFNIRVRLPAGASMDQLAGLRLLLTPAGT